MLGAKTLVDKQILLIATIRVERSPIGGHPDKSHAAAAALPDLTMHWVGFISIAIFVAAYALVIAEESTHLRKSNPVIVAGGMLWFMLAGLYAAHHLFLQLDHSHHLFHLHFLHHHHQDLLLLHHHLDYHLDSSTM